MATVKEKAENVEKKTKAATRKAADKAAATTIEAKKTTRATARKAQAKAEAAGAQIAEKAAVAEIEAKKVASKVKRTAKATTAKAKAAVETAKAPAKKARAAKLEIVIQSVMGGAITPEEIAAKLPKGAVSAYVKVEENKFYWVAKDGETGSVEIW